MNFGRTLLAATFLMGFLLAGCGEDKHSSTPTDSGQPPTTTTPPVTTPPSGPSAPSTTPNPQPVAANPAIENARSQFLDIVRDWRTRLLDIIHRRFGDLKTRFPNRRAELEQAESRLKRSVEESHQAMVNDIRGYQAASRHDMIQFARTAVNRASSQVDGELARLEEEYR